MYSKQWLIWAGHHFPSMVCCGGGVSHGKLRYGWRFLGTMYGKRRDSFAIIFLDYLRRWVGTTVPAPQFGLVQSSNWRDRSIFKHSKLMWNSYGIGTGALTLNSTSSFFRFTSIQSKRTKIHFYLIIRFNSCTSTNGTGTVFLYPDQCNSFLNVIVGHS